MALHTMPGPVILADDQGHSLSLTDVQFDDGSTDLTFTVSTMVGDIAAVLPLLVSDAGVALGMALDAGDLTISEVVGLGVQTVALHHGDIHVADLVIGR